jgi:vancomycin resistance protein YoaR
MKKLKIPTPKKKEKNLKEESDILVIKNHPWKQIGKTAGWFILGAILGLFFFISFLGIVYQQLYGKVVFPGVYVNRVDFSGKSQDVVQRYFAEKNTDIQKTTITFVVNDQIATVSAKELSLGYDEKLLAKQAFSIGRSSNFISNISLMLQAYMYGINLPPAYHYDEDKLATVLRPLKDSIYKDPVDALFTFENNRVTAFKPSENGQTINIDQIKETLLNRTIRANPKALPANSTITIPVVSLEPKITTEKVNNLGIKELIGTGTSLFQHSIENRVYNVTLASSRLNGILVSPGETFSVVKALGDISSLTGYKQAYVISGGKTVLGDGGGVCQVSTTLFRAALNAGLPIVERNPHAYRVGYYEEDSPPGIDAAIYSPSVDLKIKNDTGHSILILMNCDSPLIFMEHLMADKSISGHQSLPRKLLPLRHSIKTIRHFPKDN